MSCLIGIYNFSGADCAGNFVGKTKTYLELETDDPAVECFVKVGNAPSYWS